MTLRFSRKAEADLTDIGRYTMQRWGAAQADRYLLQLQDCCEQLAVRPTLGRECQDIRPGLRRMESGSHVIFYREADEGIFVSRILHARMLPERHRLDEDPVG